MTKYWFKPKRYGWGFVPISREGWLMTALLLALVLVAAHFNGLFAEVTETAQIFCFLINTLILTVVFSIVARPRTRGEVKWRWGGKK